MKLVEFTEISANEKIHINLIAGIEYGKPTWVARLRSRKEWTLYKRARHTAEERILLKKAGYLCSSEDVFAFFRGKELVPYCLIADSGAQAESLPFERFSSLQVQRKYFRGPTRLKAEYQNIRTGSFGYCIVQNISVSGVQFVTASTNDLKLLDEVAVSIILDVPNRNHIMKKAITRHVEGINVGAEFATAVEQDREIVFYPV